MNFQRSKKATKKDLTFKFSLKTTVGLNTAVNHRQKSCVDKSFKKKTRDFPRKAEKGTTRNNNISAASIRDTSLPRPTTLPPSTLAAAATAAEEDEAAFLATFAGSWL